MKKNIYEGSFLEKDIRPVNFNAAIKAAYQKDLEWLLRRKKQFIKVNCPACSSGRKSPYFKKKGFVYVECKDCATVYIDPRPSAELTQEFYKHSKGYDFWAKYIFPASEATRREKICKPRIKEIIALCEQYKVGRGCFVEVGPGFGTFSEEVVKSGYFKETIVVEPAPALAVSCRARKLRVIEAPIQEAVLGEEVDVVATFEVLEHLFSPKLFIEGCRSILNPKGLLVLSCPNIKGFDFVAGGKENSPFDHEHLNYFHPKSMAILLERCGLEVIDISTPGVLDVDLIRSAILRGDISVEKQPFLKQMFLDDWDEAKGRAFQEFLAEHLMSGHMWVVARKK